MSDTALTFSDLGLSPEMLQRCTEMGYETPSPIQEATIPATLKGGDLVGIAQTGSGKTAAFGIPIIEKLNPEQRSPQALIICPTRELAVQVQKALADFAKGRGVKFATLYGGSPIDSQFRELRANPQIVVGTPGRIMDHLKRRSLDLSGLSFVIMDEADRMLDMGFREDMEEILAGAPDERQNLFFSATMNQGVKRLISRFGNDPQWVEIKGPSRAAQNVSQTYYDSRWQSKREILFRLLEMNPPHQAVIFCNTKRVVDECLEALLSNGFPADRLHGDMTQPMRERVLRRFRAGQVSLLVATDVAGRGLDVEGVDLVINYDLPQDEDDYVHRIGRTGRAGREGRAISMISNRERGKLRRIENHAGCEIRRVKVPVPADLQAARGKQLLDALKRQIETGKSDPEASELQSLVEEGEDGEGGTNWQMIAAGLFDLWRDATTREIDPIPEDGGKGRFEQERRREPRDRGERGERGGRDDRRGRDDRGGRNDRNDRNDRGGRRDDRGGREDRGSRDDRGGRDRGHWDERRDRQGRDEANPDQRGGFNERRERDRDSDRDQRNAPAPEEGKQRIFIGLGKIDQLRPGELAGLLYNESGAPDGVIGKIALFPRHTLVDVDNEWSEKIISACRGSRYRGRPFRIKQDFDQS